MTTINFELKNSVSTQGNATNGRSYGKFVKSPSINVAYSSDSDDYDAAIIAAGIARIGKRPLRTLQRLDAFLDELDAEEDGT